MRKNHLNLLAPCASHLAHAPNTDLANTLKAYLATKKKTDKLSSVKIKSLKKVVAQVGCTTANPYGSRALMMPPTEARGG